MKKISGAIQLSMFSLLWASLTFLTADQAVAGVFKITRLRLYFANQRAETVIEKNSPNLKAFADLTIEGTGLLQGFWEVDGRTLANVNQHIANDRGTITLETPDLPGIPTYESGAHRLRLVVTSPAPAANLPEAIYFVAGQSVKPYALTTIGPPSGAVIPYEPTVFRWKASEGSTAYLITFFSADEKPLFSAYTRDLDYKLSRVILNNNFMPGGEYLWQVVSYGAGQNQLGAGPMAHFTFRARQ